jgi:Na+-transporting methylmalonyl-CoA/oxaloacetate decarboxylase gamma subunit
MLYTITLVLVILWLMARVTWLLSKSIRNAVEQRRRQTVLNKNEVERLDRICNPSKYLGK